MLFAAGIGAGHACIGARIEWAYYVQAPPFRAEPFSHEAYLWASSYGLHHWGFVAWALLLPADNGDRVPFLCPQVCRNLKYSISAHQLFERYARIRFTRPADGQLFYGRSDWWRRELTRFFYATDLGFYRSGLQASRTDFALGDLIVVAVCVVLYLLCQRLVGV